MKRIICFSLFMMFTFIISLSCKSQEEVKGKNYLSAGYGFLPIEIRNNNLSSYYGENFSTNYFGPIYFKYEHFFEYNLSAGISYAYAIYKFDYDVEYHEYINNIYVLEYFHQTETHTSQSVLVRMNYHFIEYQKKSIWDPYIGMGLGYRKVSYELANTGNGSYSYYQGTFTNSSSLGMDATFGLRCFIQFGTTFSF